MNLYLLHYNNYYNRIVKKEETLSDYLPYQIGETIENINFIPNDFINTEQIVNWQDKDPDYLIVADKDNNIVSRWFVISTMRTRAGQLRLTLHRDLVVDFYSNIINAPCFIEKATLQPNDPMIFNKENMTFNQIKTSETQLKDETQSAWVVGYIPRDSFSTAVTITGEVSPIADITVADINNWEYFQYTNNAFRSNPNQLKYLGYSNSQYYTYSVSNLGVPSAVIHDAPFVFGCDSYGNLLDDSTFKYPNSYALSVGLLPYSSLSERNIAVAGYKNTLPANWINNISELNTQSYAYTNCKSFQETEALRALENKIIYDTNSGLYYKITLNSNVVSEYINITSGNLFNSLSNGLTLATGLFGVPDDKSFQVYVKYTNYTISLSIVHLEYNVTIDSDRYHLEDSPYDMFCIPYSNDLKIYKNGTQILTGNKSLAVGIGVDIGAEAGDLENPDPENISGSANIYDVQLLPYCPVRYMIKEDGTFDIGNHKVDYIKDQNSNDIGVILWATTSQFTFDIPYNIEITEPKIQNECDMYRLCSPNFNGQFQFSAAMNGGVNYFNVDCSYKPFNPYIHINPNFGGLYGEDFDDARGLICGGDFSLPQLSNAWANYVMNNKNFGNIFERDIQNMEENRNIQRWQEGVGIATGALGSAISGAAAGAMIGGPVGAAIGGIAGGLLSGGAGAADMVLNERAYNEALDYKKDMYGYQMGNIQALPSSLAKTSALTYNNKIFPILEYYTCTDEEKQALRDKIKYNGMTVGRIGIIVDFIRDEKTYIKGKLIRIENIDEDFHVLNAIADEMNKGVFI